jgi:hypothetical protein
VEFTCRSRGCSCALPCIDELQQQGAPGSLMIRNPKRAEHPRDSLVLQTTLRRASQPFREKHFEKSHWGFVGYICSGNREPHPSKPQLLLAQKLEERKMHHEQALILRAEAPAPLRGVREAPEVRSGTSSRSLARDPGAQQKLRPLNLIACCASKWLQWLLIRGCTAGRCEA